MPDIVVRVVPRAGTEGELGGATLTERFEQRVDELGSSISDIAHRLRSRLDTELSEERSSAWGLNEVHLTFSLDLEAEAGIVVAKAKTTAGFEVALKWSRNRSD